jgi:hypothetical protein
MTISYIAKNNDYWLNVAVEGGPVVAVPTGLKIDRTGQKLIRQPRRKTGASISRFSKA